MYEKKRKSDILIIATNASSSLGTASASSDGPLGCFGLNHVINKEMLHCCIMLVLHHSY